MNKSISWDLLKKTYRDILVILSPPRSSSTALARVFWEHPDISFYCHEPFDFVYYRDGHLSEVYEYLQRPLKLQDKGRNLLIKEMTFQVGDHIDILAELSSHPLIFNMRDPRLSIMSRLKKRELQTGEQSYPYVESGWCTLFRQVEYCKQREIPYVLVESSMYRNAPERVFRGLYGKLNLSFSKKMLEWQSKSHLTFEGMGDEQRVFYQRVLKSRKLETAMEPVPEIDSFPPSFQAHVRECLGIYQGLLNDEALIAG